MSDEFYRAFEDRLRGSREVIKERLLAYADFMVPLQALYPAGKAFDMGCGRGEWLGLLTEWGFSPLGIDLDAGMLRACTELGLHVEHGDAIARLKSLPDASQVVVSAFHVVEHISFDDLRTVIAEALRVLVPGGLLVLETPNPENIAVGTNQFYLDPTHTRPIPALLLSFLPEFYGFARTKVLRLQESAALRAVRAPSLLDVLAGVSPDYAVVAQKSGDETFMGALDGAFGRSYGLGLDTLCSRYEDGKAATERKHAERFELLEQRLRQAEDYILELKAAKDRKPLRWAFCQVRDLLWRIARPGTLFALRHGILYLRARPHLKARMRSLLQDSALGRRVLGRLAGSNEANWMLSHELHDLAPVSDRPRHLYVDVSGVAREDLRTGIQRVIRGLLVAMFGKPPAGYEIKPVYARLGQFGYCHALKYTQSLSGPAIEVTEEPPICPEPGDIFLGLDFQAHAVSVQKPYLEHLHNQGLKVYFVVYDLLPVHFPRWFPDVAADGHNKWLTTIAQFDGAIGISQAVVNDLKDWFANNSRPANPDFLLDAFTLGADIVNSVPTKGVVNESECILPLIAGKPCFLMVGTIEPRKGHEQVLAAFEQLWMQRKDVVLGIVGKQGWMVDELANRLNRHPERNKHLFWLQGISDEYLEKLYAASTCLIAASYGEGFGLPLIEAARHGLPIMARDIPVFREVAGSHAYYFHTDIADDLAMAISNWLLMFNKAQHPQSNNMPWTTWEESAQMLCRVILPDAQ